MTLADELPKLIKEFEEFAKIDIKKAARNLANANVFIVVDPRSSRVFPLYWLLHLRGEGKSLSDSKRSNQSLKRFRPLLTQLGYEEISEGEPGFSDAWAALLEACRILGTVPSKRNGRPDWSGRSFFIRLEASRAAEYDAVAPEYLVSDASQLEGLHSQVTTNRYERDPKLRKICIGYFTSKDGKLRCQSCHFCFEEAYGSIGVGFIHIHHVDPLGNGQLERLVNPQTDLIPLCPNCHAMAHRGTLKGSNPRTALELAAIREYHRK